MNAYRFMRLNPWHAEPEIVHTSIRSFEEKQEEMKTVIARVFTLCAVVLMLALPRISQAQAGMAVSSYFGANNVAYCSARTLVTANGIQGPVDYSTATGSITIEVSTLTTKAVISDTIATNYALLTGWGYWTPTGTTEDIPVLVQGQFSQSSAGVANLDVVLNNATTGALVYSSGTLGKAGKNVIAIGVITPPIFDGSSPVSHKRITGSATATAKSAKK